MKFKLEAYLKTVIKKGRIRRRTEATKCKLTKKLSRRNE